MTTPKTRRPRRGPTSAPEGAPNVSAETAPGDASARGAAPCAGTPGDDPSPCGRSGRAEGGTADGYATPGDPEPFGTGHGCDHPPSFCGPQFEQGRLDALAEAALRGRTFVERFYALRALVALHEREAADRARRESREMVAHVVPIAGTVLGSLASSARSKAELARATARDRMVQFENFMRRFDAFVTRVAESTLAERERSEILAAALRRKPVKRRKSS